MAKRKTIHPLNDPIYKDALKGFHVTAKQNMIFQSIADAGYQIDCDVITHRHFWHDDWTACPVCGAIPDYDGVIIHRGKQ
jgi:hypothetical protein